MASLIDLFKGSLYDNSVKQDTETNVEEDKTGLIAKFEKLKGSSDAIPNVKADVDTLVETEFTGIRIKSGVDLNNPLIYGNEAIRIGNRTTRTLDDMKAGTHGELGSGGLIGKGIGALTGGKLNSISDVRNKIDDTIGIPVPLIPTRVASKLGPGVSVQDILDGKNGTELGKFLKQTGGGNPKTIITNVAGNAIKLGKDKLRGVLFGNSTSIGVAKPKNNYNWYTDTATYSTAKSDQKVNDIASADDLLLSTEYATGINLAKYSPIYGVDRKSDLWNDNRDDITKQRIYDDRPNLEALSVYSSTQPYVNYKDADNRSPLFKKSLEEKYQINSKIDGINLAEYGSKSTTDLEDMDLIPFWIGSVSDAKTKIHFRALLSGITETVTPSWSSNNFFGNPFAFKTYTGIERSVTFSLKIYCMSVLELNNNWQKVNLLTKLTYPTIVGGLINPPIIDFRLGDIYNKKIGNISSLSYTYPDEGTWETDPYIGLLPKIIDVSITIDFIENTDIVNSNLYDYTRSAEAVKLQNEKSQATDFNTNSNGTTTGKSSTFTPVKATISGLVPLTAPVSKNLAGMPKSLSTGKAIPTPKDTTSGVSNPVESQTSTSDSLGGKTATEAIAESQSSMQLTVAQSQVWISQLKLNRFKPYNGLRYTGDEPGDVVFIREDDYFTDVVIVSTVGDVTEYTSTQ
jgi:hypothetical protein